MAPSRHQLHPPPGDPPSLPPSRGRVAPRGATEGTPGPGGDRLGQPPRPLTDGVGGPGVGEMRGAPGAGKGRGGGDLLSNLPNPKC